MSVSHVKRPPGHMDYGVLKLATAACNLSPVRSLYDVVT